MLYLILINHQSLSQQKLKTAVGASTSIYWPFPAPAHLHDGNN
jgi:hypothetical protein